MNIKKLSLLLGTAALLALGVSLAGCSTNLNTNFDSHFTQDGCLKRDSTEIKFQLETPSRIKFYVEVSGSMNGFFRANQPTHFKTDFWSVINYYSSLAPNITVLTNDGDDGASVPLNEFQTKMNTGAFISTASTKVPIMLQSIISNLDVNRGEVAVLVSDMKYSPVGAAAPAVLMTQYSTDISKILGDYGKAVSLICATSNYLDKSGNDVSTTSPYYYLIIGNQENVAEVRNGISALLQMNDHFIDNIDSGFDFGRPSYSFSVSNKCDQFEGEPTFSGYEEAEDGDTCTIKLKVDLENYRWIMEKKQYFEQAFKAAPKYGSEIKFSVDSIEIKNVTGSSKELKRKVTATVSIKVFHMATDSEVIEWSLALPDTDYTLFNPFFDGAIDENDPTKSFSVLDFLKGMFHGGVVNKETVPNYILISKES